MLAAARKHKRVVQVGTQRRSTPHLIEARDRVIREGKLGKIGLRRDLLLLPHAARTESAGHRAARVPRLRDVDGPGADAAVQPSWSTRAAGGRSWSTATASSATCASTCSTRSAGCSTWAGPRRISSAGGILVRQGQQVEHHRHADRHVRLRRPRRSSGRIAPGAARPTRSTPGALTLYGDKGTLKASVFSYDFIPRRQGQPVHQRRRLRTRAVPRGQDREGPRTARRPGDPRPHEGLPRGHRASRGKPVADIEQGYISTASCILANISMQARPDAGWDPATGRSWSATRRPTGSCAAVPRAVGPPRPGVVPGSERFSRRGPPGLRGGPGVDGLGLGLDHLEASARAQEAMKYRRPSRVAETLSLGSRASRGPPWLPRALLVRRREKAAPFVATRSGAGGRAPASCRASSCPRTSRSPGPRRGSGGGRKVPLAWSFADHDQSTDQFIATRQASSRTPQSRSPEAERVPSNCERFGTRPVSRRPPSRRSPGRPPPRVPRRASSSGPHRAHSW